MRTTLLLLLIPLVAMGCEQAPVFDIESTSPAESGGGRGEPPTDEEYDVYMNPLVTASVRWLPEMEILERAPVGGTMQSSYFRTTEMNREIRRGYMEFEIPYFGEPIRRATLLIDESDGWTSTPVPPDTQYVSYYEDVDLAITEEDFWRPVTQIPGEAITDGNEDDIIAAFDVTHLVATHQGQLLGFRIHRKDDIYETLYGFAGAGWGDADDTFLMIRFQRDWKGDVGGDW